MSGKEGSQTPLRFWRRPNAAGSGTENSTLRTPGHSRKSSITEFDKGNSDAWDDDVKSVGLTTSPRREHPVSSPVASPQTSPFHISLTTPSSPSRVVRGMPPLAEGALVHPPLSHTRLASTSPSHHPHTGAPQSAFPATQFRGHARSRSHDFSIKPVEAKPVEAKPSHPPPIERLAASDEGAQAGIDETAQAANAAEQTASKTETRKIGVMRRASSQESRSPATVILDQKALKFAKLLEAPMADLEAVRQLSWNGISIEFRPIFWMLLSGYVPVNKERRTVALTKKRAEYWDLLVNQHYLPQKDEAEQSTFRQIQMDIERTGAGYGMFRQEKTKELLCRILYIWAIRHGACGYVQGMNDLLLPYLIVFLHPHTPHADGGYQIEQMDIDTIESTALAQVEADCFWCFNNLLNGLQENFTFAQPGIQTKVLLLSELTAQTDRALHSHLQALRIEYLQFALRWMNCLLTRELPILCAIRLWDTYHAEVDGFAVFHVYVCAAFLNFFSRSVLEQADFQDALLLLQRTPTERWSNVEIELILAQAYQLKHARDTQK
eukprot:m.504515 g.504515  ORF g.504515 m.504515 type:complete len:551 (+) comp57355_c0_seq5:53-1705(+)